MGLPAEACGGDLALPSLAPSLSSGAPGAEAKVPCPLAPPARAQGVLGSWLPPQSFRSRPDSEKHAQPQPGPGLQAVWLTGVCRQTSQGQSEVRE